VPLVQDLLRDLRAERARTNELNEQVRLRVAQRTDVLERRLGALYHQATLDPLTGLRNRRLMDKALPRLIGHARTCGNECGVLMLDVDHFKALNDARGHPVGDDFLRDLGQLIKSGLHAERDMAFRVGGDEFVITRSDTSPAACQSLAERLITLSEAMGKTYRLPAVPKLSVGWAVLSEAPEPTAGPLLALADKRLYQAKSSGSRIARAS
ncbi:MAG TPA: GGDEF domain-containing protein, partial [Tepidisphaeraceae bacterium]|nr:GGDEF domain-containing protein [Tepidisphaeraceae bacterium]